MASDNTIRIQIFTGADNQAYFRVVARNGRIIAVGGEAFSKIGNAQRAAEKFASDYLKGEVDIKVVDEKTGETKRQVSGVAKRDTGRAPAKKAAANKAPAKKTAKK